ncbi:hypothetical protein HMPREF0992_00164 [Lachnospiraceae bacterium 6_1_63FAA]|nr:hypothetical protein HMPREF0992_00164 [Lachnospiraceae bacterium 6_1_63FAA]
MSEICNDELRQDFLNETLDAIESLNKKAETDAEKYLTYLLAKTIKENVEFIEQ